MGASRVAEGFTVRSALSVEVDMALHTLVDITGPLGDAGWPKPCRTFITLCDSDDKP
jgi:hypothetical protein